MTGDQLFTIPVDHIVLSRYSYDELIEQRIASRNDRIDLESEYAKEISRLQAIIESRDREIEMLKRDYTDLSDREAKIAYRLHEANENILKLKSEIHLLNEELCRTDEIEEVPHAVPEA